MSDETAAELGGRVGLRSALIDEVCSRFEAAWRAGQRPRIEDFVPDASPDTNRAIQRGLLVQLVGIDLECRWKTADGTNDPPSPHDLPDAGPDRSSRADASDIPSLPKRPRLADYAARYLMLGPVEQLPAESLANEYYVRRRYGDSPTSGEYLDAYGPLHPELADLLRAVDNEMASAKHPSSALPADGNPQSGTTVEYFGDYVLLERLGKGGMGVVYKARQVSLKRLVAIKMVLAGQLADEQDIRRFHLEAEAAANLDHPCIVRIIEIGEHDGRHYFSMDLIEGESLETRLREHPLPPREAVQLLEQVARAIAYAHRRGVIHRDLKPANILVNRQNQPRVTDFGLAKRVQSDSSLTATGMVLGTPSYMPPEQAAGQLDQISERSDVYSLGATLYAMLSGCPPFQAATAMEVLFQVREQDPVPLRQLNPNLPRDLETICAKCLEKEPRRRYASADELADELARFLADKPILARAVGKPERLWRWCKRQPVVAGLASSVALSLVVGVVAASFFAIRANEQKKRADERAAEATANAQLAEERMAEANANAALAKLKVAEAQAQSRRADKEKENAKQNFNIARDAVKRYTTQVANDPRLKPHDLERLRRDLLESANEFYEKLTRQEADNAGLQHERVDAYGARGAIEMSIGNRSESETAYKNAIAAATQLAQIHGAEPKYQHCLAGKLNNLGNLYASTDRAKEAESAYKEALDILKRSAAQHPDVLTCQSFLANVHHNLGDIYKHMGRTKKAESAFKEALAIERVLVEKHPEMPDYQSVLATSINNLGLLYQTLGRVKEAEAAYKEALAVQVVLADKHPEEPEYQESLADSHHNLGTVYQDAGRTKEAEAANMQALAIRRLLVEKHPEVPEYLERLARTHSCLGYLHRDTGRDKDAEVAYKKAHAIRTGLVEKHPGTPEYLKGLASTHNDLASLYESAGRATDAEAAYKETLAIISVLAERYPEVPEYQSELACSHNDLGLVYEATARTREAEAAYKKALAIFAVLAKKYSEVPKYRSCLAKCHYNLGNIYELTGRTKEAETAYKKTWAIQKTLAEDFPEVPEYRSDPPKRYRGLASIGSDGTMDAVSRAKPPELSDFEIPAEPRIAVPNVHEGPANAPNSAHSRASF